MPQDDKPDRAVVDEHLSPPKQPIDAHTLDALGKAEPSETADHAPLVELDADITEDELRRLSIEGAHKGVVARDEDAPGTDPIREQLARDLEAIRKRGGGVEIPPDISERR
jgi:hypothetical protein